MDRWEIRPSRTRGPLRHFCSARRVADVAAVLKNSGAVRPSHALDGEEFNLSFVLHKVTPEVSEKLNEWLGRCLRSRRRSPRRRLLLRCRSDPGPGPGADPSAGSDPDPALPLCRDASIPAMPAMPVLARRAAPISRSQTWHTVGVALPPPRDILPPIPMPPARRSL